MTEAGGSRDERDFFSVLADGTRQHLPSGVASLALRSQPARGGLEVVFSDRFQFLLGFFFGRSIRSRRTIEQQVLCRPGYLGDEVKTST
jgi:hypothetical protein